MRIALVGAEFEENLALRYIRGALEQAGHETRQVVFNSREETERAAREVARSGAALTGFSMVFTYRAREFAALATRCRELGYAGHVVAGGHFAAFNAEALLRDVPAFDSIACGEGEELMLELAAHLGDLAEVRGLIWRDSSGRTVRNAPAVKPPDLDALPYPPRKQPGDTYLGLPIVNLLASRGCTHACGFCSIAAWHQLCGGARFRLRKMECVAEELARLYGQGVRIFNFHDDNFFLADREAMFKRARTLERELDRRGVGRIAFAVKSRPDSVDEELFAYLKSLGLFRVFLGIESGTASSLRYLGRGQTREENVRALEIVNRLDLHCCFNLLLLNPDTTLDDLDGQLAFLRAHPHNPLNFCRTEVYAGTPLERRLRREGRLLGDYWGYNYRIADERVQQVFKVLYTALEHRHFGEPNLQHCTMDVDFEHQLLAHFFSSPPGLRQAAKDYIATVNLNTCDYLEEIAAAARSGLTTEAQYRDFVEELRRRVSADNVRLLQQGKLLVARIRAAAHAREETGIGAGWKQEVAAIGLAAVLTFASTQGIAAEERVAEPQDGDPALIFDQVKEEVLPQYVRFLEAPCALRLTLQLAGDGHPVVCFAENADTQERVRGFAPNDLVFAPAEAGGKTYHVTFTRDEVEAAMKVAPRAALPEGDPALIREQFKGETLPWIGMLVKPPRDLRVELWVDAGGRVCYAAAYQGLKAPVSGPLTADDARRAAGLIEQLGAEEYATREKAQTDLIALGLGVLPELKAALAKTADAEVRTRCRNAIRDLQGHLPEEDRLLPIVLGLHYPNEAARGKRFVLAFTRQEVDEARRRKEEENTHICEMAPAPNPGE